jgi:hypothetical protein
MKSVLKKIKKLPTFEWMIQNYNSVAWVPHLFVAIILYQSLPNPRSAQIIARISTDLFLFPPGIFALVNDLDFNQVVGLTNFARCISLIGLAVFILPHRKLRAFGGIAYTLGAAITLSLSYSSGKIDHQFIIFGLPGLIALDELCSSGTKFVRFGLFFFFAQSCIVKVANGWVSSDFSALSVWLQQYQLHYWNTALGKTLLAFTDQYPFAWKFADIAVVAGEGLIAFLFLATNYFRRTTVLIILSIFHLSIDQLFGIAFSPLLLPYWWALQHPLGESNNSSMSPRFVWLVFGFFALFILPRLGGPLYLWVAGLCLVIYIWETKNNHLKQPLDLISLSRRNRLILAIFFIFNCVTIATACFNHEAFPSFGGPMFGIFQADNSTEVDLCKISIESTDQPKNAESKRSVRKFERGYWKKKLEQYLIVSTPGFGKAFTCPFHSFQPIQDTVAFRKTIDQILDREGITVKLVRIKPINPFSR